MAESNAVLVQSAVDIIWNRGELDLADSLFHSDYVNHGGVIPDIVHGPEAIKFSVVLYRTAYPAMFIAIDRLVVDGDMVELGWTVHAVLLRQSRRFAARRQTRVSGTTHARVVHDRVVESWTTWNARGAVRARGRTAAVEWERFADRSPDELLVRPDSREPEE